MAEINRVTLFGKLNPATYKAVEGATVFCKLRGNPYVELEHWLAQLLQLPDSDWHRAIKHWQLDMSMLARDLTAALDRLPRGATSISGIAENIADAVERGWVYGTLLYGDNVVRSGYMLVGMLKTKNLRNALVAISRQFEKLRVEDVSDALPKVIAGSPEDGEGASDGSSGSAGAGEPGEASGAIAPAAMGKQEALKKFTVDLTEQARGGKMDPIVGRDDEIRQVVDILMRRRQNNPILVGEAG
ncbi:MAG: type VI secretion system ATPase TssH, partial [Burkholderiales bacterium]|nr:type VI secretion system ATPase TssH [Burkholderiales bacterium]